MCVYIFYVIIYKKMINPLHLQRQFLSSSTTIIGGGTQCNKPFNPPKEKPKTAKIYLNSTDKMSGTNNEATFKVNLPTEFTTQDLGLTLNNFIPIYPTGTDAGIVQVNLVGVNNPYTYSSSNQTTHRSLGMFPIDRGTFPIVRTGQSNLNAEIITTDRTLFHRPITLMLSSPTGMDLSTMCNWSAELTITERP